MKHTQLQSIAADRAASHRKAKHIKMQASDGLSLTGVAAMFCMNVLLKLPGPMGDKKYNIKNK